MKTGDMSEIKRSKTNICNYIQAKPLKHAYLASIQPGSLERPVLSAAKHFVELTGCEIKTVWQGGCALSNRGH